MPWPRSAECGAGCGIFLLVNRCSTVLLRGSHAAYSVSPYVDEHGEDDHNLKRGRPLRLSSERMDQLSCLWSEHKLAGEVVRERVMRDRVIREGFY